jgi:hypothetical protein
MGRLERKAGFEQPRKPPRAPTSLEAAQRRVKLALVAVAWIVQVFSTAQLANTVVLSWVLRELPYTWQWAVVQVPLAAVGIAAVVVAHRSLWFDTPRTARVALVILVAALGYAAMWFLVPDSWDPFSTGA